MSPDSRSADIVESRRGIRHAKKDWDTEEKQMAAAGF
jgi:hypothetical protein